jgi:MinD-like ATPase involved in chromosome partitioning or flagellar assembly
VIAVVAAPAPLADRLADELRDEGVTVIATVDPAGLAVVADVGSEISPRLRDADTLVVAAPGALTAALVVQCDRLGVRIVMLAERPADVRAARAFGLPDPLPSDAPGWRIVAAARGSGIDAEPAPHEPGRVLVVWGVEGAPGRTTIAIELALAFARDGAHVALVDADSRAPSVAISVGLVEESPGFAAACRQAEFGLLDAGELLRVSVPLGDADGRVDVLTGISRVSRWPELSGRRVAAALEALRDWADVVVVDVSASLEADEEIVSDVDGPRRNAATLAALGVADQVVAVASGDPVGLARLVRGYSELRRLVGTTPVRVVVNRLRSGPLGIDPRGQVRRALERFSGVTDVSFVPDDRRAADAALLAARPVGEAAARSGLAQAVRRLAAELSPPARQGGPRAAGATRRARRRSAPAPAARPGAVVRDA